MSSYSRIIHNSQLIKIYIHQKIIQMHCTNADLTLTTSIQTITFLMVNVKKKKISNSKTFDNS